MNREKRLNFAKTYLNKPIEFWKRVIFSDESSIFLAQMEIRLEKTQY